MINRLNPKLNPLTTNLVKYYISFFLICSMEHYKKRSFIFKNNLTYKAPLVGSRSNRFWKDLKNLIEFERENYNR